MLSSIIRWLCLNWPASCWFSACREGIPPHTQISSDNGDNVKAFPCTGTRCFDTSAKRCKTCRIPDAGAVYVGYYCVSRCLESWTAPRQNNLYCGSSSIYSSINSYIVASIFSCRQKQHHARCARDTLVSRLVFLEPFYLHQYLGKE